MKTAKSSKINRHILNNELWGYVKYVSDVALLMMRIKSESDLRSGKVEKSNSTSVATRRATDETCTKTEWH